MEAGRRAELMAPAAAVCPIQVQSLRSNARPSGQMIKLDWSNDSHEAARERGEVSRSAGRSSRQLMYLTAAADELLLHSLHENHLSNTQSDVSDQGTRYGDRREHMDEGHGQLGQ